MLLTEGEIKLFGMKTLSLDDRGHLARFGIFLFPLVRMMFCDVKPSDVRERLGGRISFGEKC